MRTEILLFKRDSRRYRGAVHRPFFEPEGTRCPSGPWFGACFLPLLPCSAPGHHTPSLLKLKRPVVPPGFPQFPGAHYATRDQLVPEGSTRGHTEGLQDQELLRSTRMQPSYLALWWELHQSIRPGPFDPSAHSSATHIPQALGPTGYWELLKGSKH